MIVLGQSEAVANWVAEQISGPERECMPRFWYEAIGFLNKDQELVGGVVYFDYRGNDIEAMAAGNGLWLTPLNLRAIFLYPFVQMNCRRMTAHAAKNNHKSRKFLTRLGFRLEGKRRQGMPDGTDRLTYGMLREECRWIEADGQKLSAKAA